MIAPHSTRAEREHAEFDGPKGFRPGGLGSDLRLALRAQTLDLSFTAGGQQRSGWIALWAADHGPELPPALVASASQTNAVLAGLAYGPVWAARPEDRPAGWERAARVLGPLVASVGDRIFHHSGPLLCNCLLVLVALGSTRPGFWLWIPFLQAVLALGAAAWSWRIGLSGETRVVRIFSSRRLERVAGGLEWAARIGLGAVLGTTLVRTGIEVAPWTSLALVVTLPFLGAVAWRRGLSPGLRLVLPIGLGGLGTWFLG